MEDLSLIAPQPHTPATDLRLRKLMEIEEAVERYVEGSDLSTLNRLLADPEYSSLALQRVGLSNRHEIWSIAQLDPKARRNRLLPYRQLGLHCYQRQLSSIPCVRILHAYSGTTRVVVEGEELLLEQDQLIMLNADVDYTITSASEGSYFIDCFFTKYYLSNTLMPRLPRDCVFTPFFEQALFGAQYSGRNTYILFNRSPSDKVLRFLIYALLAFTGNVPLMDEVLSSYVFLIFHELLLRYANEHTVAPPSDSVSPTATDLVDYIFANFESVTLASASESFHFTPDYMGKLVKRLTGESFVDLVRNIRLIKAAELLESSDSPISAVANEVGYQNISHFYRLFEDHFGCTPAAYREDKRRRALTSGGTAALGAAQPDGPRTHNFFP